MHAVTEMGTPREYNDIAVIDIHDGSRSRVEARASIKLATLAQAISTTASTAANNTQEETRAS